MFPNITPAGDLSDGIPSLNMNGDDRKIGFQAEFRASDPDRGVNRGHLHAEVISRNSHSKSRHLSSGKPPNCPDAEQFHSGMNKVLLLMGSAMPDVVLSENHSLRNKSFGMVDHCCRSVCDSGPALIQRLQRFCTGRCLSFFTLF